MKVENNVEKNQVAPASLGDKTDRIQLLDISDEGNFQKKNEHVAQDKVASKGTIKEELLQQVMVSDYASRQVIKFPNSFRKLVRLELKIDVVNVILKPSLSLLKSHDHKLQKWNKT